MLLKIWQESKSILFNKEKEKKDCIKLLFFLYRYISSGLIKIQQELLHLHPTYNILSARAGDSDRELAVVKKKFTFLHQTFDINSINGQYSLEGLDILAHSFILTKNGKPVAIVSKKFFSWTDSYGVEISGYEDHVLILALVIVLDQVLYDNR